MKNEIRERKDLLNRLHRVNKSLNTISFLVENNDLESAALIARRAFDRLLAVLADMKDKNAYNKAYLDMVMSNRMPEFFKDKSMLEEAEKQIDAAESLEKEKAALEDIFMRLENYASQTAKELRVVYPYQFDWWGAARQFIKKRAKELLVVLSLLLIFLVSTKLWRAAQLKRHALTGEYFSGTNFETLVKTKWDPKVDFNWGQKSPLRDMPADNFSVRWTGLIKIPKDDTYWFYTRSDDGVRLWVNNQLIFENWTDHSNVLDHGSIKLEKGVYPIKLEYYEHLGFSKIQLYWKPESEPSKKIVKQKFFVKDANP